MSRVCTGITKRVRKGKSVSPGTRALFIFITCQHVPQCLHSYTLTIILSSGDCISKLTCEKPKYELKVIDAVVKVQEMLLADGWEPAGETASANYRVITKESYPLPGAVICSGGKPRFKKNGWYCAVGKQTVRFYHPLPKLDGKSPEDHIPHRNTFLPFDFWEWLGEPDPRDLEAVQECIRKAGFTGDARKELFAGFMERTRAAIERNERKLEEEKWPESRKYLERDLGNLRLMLKAEEQVYNGGAI